MLRDPLLAEDAAHDAIIQALLSLDRLRCPDRFGSWLAGIGLNICRRWLRDRGGRDWSWEALIGGSAVPEPVDWSSDPAITAERRDLTDRVRRAVAALPPGQRAAVLLFYLSGLTCQETAEALGIQTGAVKGRLHKARASLRHTLSAQWKEVTVITDTPMVEMRVTDILRQPTEEEGIDRHSVVLRRDETGQRLLIWVGRPEAEAIALFLDRVETPRPTTIKFFVNTLAALKAELQEVQVTRLQDEVFYAEAILATPGGMVTVDARPSDALALAIAVDAPIRVDSSVLQQSALGESDDLPADARKVKMVLRPPTSGKPPYGALLVAETEDA
jgi:RNA polymerase sigma factor (sigma-70 family)